ncbi:HMA2 domain-containing protein [Endozoicomonas montiporae]|uniref:P-type ATPase n=1 Tax=Endozoicomonas montiporae TaxID=1027273 RepID=UPI000B192066|nr:hypothetical protein [Endozoicomonas montiporae]
MSGVEVKHHLPGRIRFKVSALRQFPGTGAWIKKSLFCIQGLHDIRVNELSCFIVVQYDAQLLTPETLTVRLVQLDLQQAETAGAEHELTRGDVVMNVIGTLAAAMLPDKWGALTTTGLITPTLLDGVSDLKEGRITVAVLDAIAVGLSTWRRDYRTAMMTQTLISLGEYMEQKTCRNSDRLLADLMRPKDSEVWRVNSDGSCESVYSSQLATGDLIELSPGAAIPADGIVMSGTALINQSSLTGENVPVPRDEKAWVYAGTSVQEGTIRVRVEKNG